MKQWIIHAKATTYFDVKGRSTKSGQAPSSWSRAETKRHPRSKTLATAPNRVTERIIVILAPLVSFVPSVDEINILFSTVLQYYTTIVRRKLIAGPRNDFAVLFLGS